MIKLTTFSVLLLVAISSCNRSGTGDTTIDYPGGRLATDSAELFAPGVISSDSFEHSAPAFSPDGRTAVWSIVEMPNWKASILEMRYEDNRWSAPERPTFSDTTASDIYPSFSPDGKTLYFSSSRKLPSGKFPSRGNLLWTVKKTEAGWSVPQPLDSVISKGGEYSPSIASNDNLYFTYGPFRSPDWNILVAEGIRGSKTTPPAQLGPPINSSGYEDGPFVAPDESYLIFESDRPGGIGGSIDLYISFKSKNGAWSTPVTLGSRVNSSAAERFARVSPDGKFLFFGSNRRQIGGKPNFDIYWISTSVIETLREQIPQADH